MESSLEFTLNWYTDPHLIFKLRVLIPHSILPLAASLSRHSRSISRVMREVWMAVGFQGYGVPARAHMGTSRIVSLDSLIYEFYWARYIGVITQFF